MEIFPLLEKELCEAQFKVVQATRLVEAKEDGRRTFVELKLNKEFTVSF
jgi:hypothetical protein